MQPSVEVSFDFHVNASLWLNSLSLISLLILLPEAALGPCAVVGVQLLIFPFES